MSVEDEQSELDLLRDIAPVPPAFRADLAEGIWSAIPTPPPAPSPNTSTMASHLAMLIVGVAVGAVVTLAVVESPIRTVQPEAPEVPTREEAPPEPPSEAVPPVEPVMEEPPESRPRLREGQRTVAPPTITEESPRTPSAHEAHDALTRERRLIDATRAALMRRNAEAALATLTRHQHEFGGDSQLAAEASALRIRAYVVLGRNHEACLGAAVFAEEHSSDPLVLQVQRIVDGLCD